MTALLGVSLLLKIDCWVLCSNFFIDNLPAMFYALEHVNLYAWDLWSVWTWLSFYSSSRCSLNLQLGCNSVGMSRMYFVSGHHMLNQFRRILCVLYIVACEQVAVSDDSGSTSPHCYYGYNKSLVDCGDHSPHAVFERSFIRSASTIVVKAILCFYITDFLFLSW